MSLVIRSRAVSRQLSASVKSFHSTASARSPHGHYHHLPFALPGSKKGVFGLKLTAYLASGFILPFVAAAYQLKKAGNAA